MVRNAACSLAAAVLISVLAAACGGGDTKTVTRTLVPSSPHPPAVVITGDGTTDQIIDAALRADDIALAGLAGYQRVACKIGSPEELGDRPACRDNESDGDSVEVLASSMCSDGWVRPEQAPDAFRASLTPDKPELVEVIKPRLAFTIYGGGFSAQAAVVVRSRMGADGQPGGVALHVTNGRISWIEASCRNLADLTTPGRVESVIFDPKNPAASSSATASPAVAATPAP